MPMQTPAIPACLAPLVDYLNGLESRAPIERVRQLLEETGVTIDDVREFVEFGDSQYRRNLVTMGPWYEVLVICWRSGQRSPIHNHAASTCGLKVLQGVCSETIFERSPCKQVVARDTHEVTAGYVCASQDDDTHQVSNLQSAGQNLVTLHIYSPPLRSMQKFSITGGEGEEWRPPVFDFVGGDGI
jgi:cysteine dioxygenase